VRVPDGSGGYAETWQALGTLWADIRPGSGRREADEFAARAAVPLRVHVRGAPAGAPSRPVPGQRFREGSRVYAIHAVAEADPRGAWLVCHCLEEVPA
jgi:Bacteriophage head-tail adaptor